jgi:hypothetical protein
MCDPLIDAALFSINSQFQSFPWFHRFALFQSLQTLPDESDGRSERRAWRVTHEKFVKCTSPLTRAARYFGLISWCSDWSAKGLKRPNGQSLIMLFGFDSGLLIRHLDLRLTPGHDSSRITGNLFGLLAPRFGQYRLPWTTATKGFIVFKHRIDHGQNWRAMATLAIAEPRRGKSQFEAIFRMA